MSESHLPFTHLDTLGFFSWTTVKHTFGVCRTGSTDITPISAPWHHINAKTAANSHQLCSKCDDLFAPPPSLWVIRLSLTIMGWHRFIYLFFFTFFAFSRHWTLVMELLRATLIARVWFTAWWSLSSVRSVFRECFRSSAFNQWWRIGYKQYTQLSLTNSGALTGSILPNAASTSATTRQNVGTDLCQFVSRSFTFGLLSTENELPSPAECKEKTRTAFRKNVKLRIRPVGKEHKWDFLFIEVYCSQHQMPLKCADSQFVTLPGTKIPSILCYTGLECTIFHIASCVSLHQSKHLLLTGAGEATE